MFGLFFHFNFMMDPLMMLYFIIFSNYLDNCFFGLTFEFFEFGNFIMIVVFLQYFFLKFSDILFLIKIL